MTKPSYDLGGTIRVCKPSETLALTKSYIEKARISRIANITGLDCLNIPVYTCYRPYSKNLTTAQGKGLTDELALCSAIMESIEHYYAEDVKVDHIAKFSKLTMANAVDPSTLMAGLVRLNNIDDYEFGWSRALNLLDNNHVYIPSTYLSLDLTSIRGDTGIFVRSTTGLASGNNKQEAILHSLFEIIERNCLAEFLKLNIREQKNRMINTTKIDDDIVSQLISKISENNISIAIFDITNKFYVPTYHCIISDISPIRKLGFQSGTGTHISKSIAMCRAITEAAQSRLTHISGARDDMFSLNYKHNWGDLLDTGNINYKERQSHTILEQSLDQQINYLLNIFNNHAYERVLCFNHTSDQEPISVIHNVVPGLMI
jgi:YcaO-like protein with predicted kinase domain